MANSKSFIATDSLGEFGMVIFPWGNYCNTRNLPHYSDDRGRTVKLRDGTPPPFDCIDSADSIDDGPGRFVARLS